MESSLDVQISARETETCHRAAFFLKVLDILALLLGVLEVLFGLLDAGGGVALLLGSQLLDLGLLLLVSLVSGVQIAAFLLDLGQQAGGADTAGSSGGPMMVVVVMMSPMRSGPGGRGAGSVLVGARHA